MPSRKIEVNELSYKKYFLSDNNIFYFTFYCFNHKKSNNINILIDITIKKDGNSKNKISRRLFSTSIEHHSMCLIYINKRSERASLSNIASVISGRGKWACVLSSVFQSVEHLRLLKLVFL